MLSEYNIAKVTKGVGVFFYVVGVFGGIIGFLIILTGDSFQKMPGMITFGSCMLSLVQGIIIYGIGQIIENTSNSRASNPTTIAPLKTRLESAEKEESEKRLAEGGWRCPDCGTINYAYWTTCKCGRGKNS